MNVGNTSLTDLMAQDLAKSGLEYTDMLTRIADGPVLEALKVSQNTKGYVIPYYDSVGKMLPFYRVKIFDADVKYLQPSNTPAYVYFPKNFSIVWKKVDHKICLLLEGEKKAALACRMGIPAVAFGGVDAWVNRTIVVPKGSEITGNVNTLIKLPNANFDSAQIGPFAVGFEDLMDRAFSHKTTFVILFDRDSPNGCSVQVQRAAAKLGFELRFRGFHMNQIRQLIIPQEFADDTGKATIEDMLLSNRGGPEKFGRLLTENMNKRTTFPVHPQMRDHIGKSLQRGKLDRKAMQNVSLAIITYLDSKGTRMYSPDDKQMYYFNADTKHLMKVTLNTNNLSGAQESEFAQHLYREFGISIAADERLAKWLGSQFAGEDPLELVVPHRVIARPGPNEDVVRWQLNSGQYIRIKGDPSNAFKIMANGADNILFESNPNITGIDSNELIREVRKQSTLPLHNWWGQVLSDVRLRYPGRAGELASYLYYISPFLLRWRGMQLPVEIITGEAGSGKSTLFEIRLNILTGDPALNNSPNEQKDWAAAIANAGGLHVTDNVQMADKNLRQKISDELCRLVTEPDPRIRMRKYFTEADERKIRVNVVFAYTAIQPPFQNSDLLQRAVQIELAKPAEDTTFDAYWKDRTIKRFGGRVGWVAHHCIVLHRFLNEIQKGAWNPNYKAKHRLVGLEQSLMIIAKIFGRDGSWIPDYLNSTMQEAISTADFALEGLCEFAHYKRAMVAAAERRAKTTKEAQQIVYRFKASDIANWAENSESFKTCHTLITPRSLGRYLQLHRHNIYQIAGIKEWGLQNNVQWYEVVPVPMKIGRASSIGQKEARESEESTKNL